MREGYMSHIVATKANNITPIPYPRSLAARSQLLLLLPGAPGGRGRDYVDHTDGCTAPGRLAGLALRGCEGFSRTFYEPFKVSAVDQVLYLLLQSPAVLCRMSKAAVILAVFCLVAVARALWHFWPFKELFILDLHWDVHAGVIQGSQGCLSVILPRSR
ncbi:hypothetical protein Nepgr_010397 [Nepenthes gracilis]|uniref:Uncharacterized protein n=1 Tax=Nepenthes gracilis TaxID=150966 RepID=A0AAD3SCM3_NEPGR|nr:hypothetical protein Nepgr_010397 [Nepenthes gracilis]